MIPHRKNYQNNRDGLLSTIVETCSNDERFVAAWLTGSYSQGNEDTVSDLDWTLIPQSKVSRPSQSRLLFEKKSIPIAPLPSQKITSNA